MNERILKLLLKYQRIEKTDHLIYREMARKEKNPENKNILLQISDNEKEHAATWKAYTKKEVKPNHTKVFLYNLLTIIMGYTFVIKLLEKGEYTATKAYEELINHIPEAKEIIAQESAHEDTLTNMLDEERLQYVGSIVLGLNDALVELSGTIAGLTFALANTKLVALSGIITGISATLSMSASNFLAEQAEGNPKALKSSIYTGVAYLITVVLLVLPYLIFPNDMCFIALATMFVTVILIIIFFNYYISVAKSTPFLKRFLHMAGISLGVALISFLIGLLVKHFLGVDV